MKGFLCNKREIIRAKERFCKVYYAVGVLICNSVQLKKGKHLSQKTRKEKTWETWVCLSSLRKRRQEVYRLRADLLHNDILN